jgi:hypothetical protein
MFVLWTVYSKMEPDQAAGPRYRPHQRLDQNCKELPTHSAVSSESQGASDTKRNYLRNKLYSICTWTFPASLLDYASRVPAVSPNLRHINPPSGLFSPQKKHANAVSLDNRVGRVVLCGSSQNQLCLSVRYALHPSRTGEKWGRQILL